jgi:hypothetical protein
MKEKFSVFRRESSGGYSTRGPIAQEMDLEAARKEISRLKSLYPYQDFVILGEVGQATRSERVTVKILAPDLSSLVRKKRKAPFSPNVIPLRNSELKTSAKQH